MVVWYAKDAEKWANNDLPYLINFVEKTLNIMPDKKKYTTVAQRVDKEICGKVKDALIGQETIGGFYDRAATNELKRLDTVKQNVILQRYGQEKETK